MKPSGNTPDVKCRSGNAEKRGIVSGVPRLPIRQDGASLITSPHTLRYQREIIHQALALLPLRAN